jgi:hypothetical protein
MVGYLAGGIILVILLHLALKTLANASPAQFQRAGFVFFIFLGLAIIFLLFRFGQTHLASIAGAAMFLAPFFKKVRLFLGIARAFRPPVLETPNLRMRFELMRRSAEGTVLAGEHEGKKLSELSQEQVIQLFEQWCQSDPDAAKLTQLWLDMHYGPSWRQDSRTEPPKASTKSMSAHEARLVLGVEENDDEATIRQAYKRLMQLNHPDKGGSSYLASKINQAKETLLGD